jgi:hypothetical protein
VHETKPTLASLAAGPSRPSPYVLVESSRSLSQLSDDPDLHLFQSVEDLPDFDHSVPDFQIYRTYAEPQASSYAGSSYVESSYAESSILSGGTPVFNNSQSHGNLARGVGSMSAAINTLLSDSVFQQYYWNVVNQHSNDSVPVSSVSMPNISSQSGAVPWGFEVDMQPFMADMPEGDTDSFGAQALLGISNLMSEPAPPSPAEITARASFPYPSEFQNYSTCYDRRPSNPWLTSPPLFFFFSANSAFVLSHVSRTNANRAHRYVLGQQQASNSYFCHASLWRTVCTDASRIQLH